MPASKRNPHLWLAWFLILAVTVFLIAPMTAHAINNGVILLLMLFAMG